MKHHRLLPTCLACYYLPGDPPPLPQHLFATLFLFLIPTASLPTMCSPAYTIHPIALHATPHYSPSPISLLKTPISPALAISSPHIASYLSPPLPTPSFLSHFPSHFALPPAFPTTPQVHPHLPSLSLLLPVSPHPPHPSDRPRLLLPLTLLPTAASLRRLRRLLL